MQPRQRRAVLVALLFAGCTTETAVVRETSVPVASTAPPTSPSPTPSPTTTTTPEPTTTGVPTTIVTPATVLETSTTIAPVVVQQTTAATPQQARPASLPVPQAPPDPKAKEPSLTLGTMEIPRVGLNKSLLEGITLATLDKGPGHWPGTALPGAMGNVVIGGHRTSKGRPFRHLEKLVPGDEVIFTTDAGRFVYRVVRTEIVKPDAVWIVNQTEAYTATLFACHPVGSTRERIVVFLELSV